MLGVRKEAKGQAGQKIAWNYGIPGMRQSRLAAAIARLHIARNACPRIEPKSHVSADGGGLRSHVVPKSG